MTGNFSRLDSVTGLTDRSRERMRWADCSRRSGPDRAGLGDAGDPGVGITVLLDCLAGRVLDAGVPGGECSGRAGGDAGTQGCWQSSLAVLWCVTMHSHPGELAADGLGGPAARREPVPAMGQRL
jgi:hypothetical protein